jgi:Zn-dependent protease/CBS domain-containing protein
MMRSGFKIGKIFGINIQIDWSWLLILLLITWNLSTVFGNLKPDWDTALRWGVAISAALLFFASVLLHELAHSLVAKARGIPVRNITLFLFGGVSNIQREPPSPGAEFLIAILGPLTSIVLGFVLTLGTIAVNTGIGTAVQDPTNLVESFGPISTLLLWLGSVNILVGFFNLIPGFPLDGGRIVRSIFWVLNDDLVKATRWASWIGQGIGWLMIFAGVAMIFGTTIPLLGTGVINGIWFAFIGWFINSSAARSYQRVVIQDILEDVPVSRMMRKQIKSVEPECIISSLVHDHVMNSDERAFPVIQDQQLVGLVTIDDIRKVSRGQWESTTVRSVMTPYDELITMDPQDDAAEAMNKLVSRDISQIPIVEGKELVGMLRRRDIVRWMQLQSDFNPLTT